MLHCSNPPERNNGHGQAAAALRFQSYTSASGSVASSS